MDRHNIHFFLSTPQNDTCDAFAHWFKCSRGAGLVNAWLRDTCCFSARPPAPPPQNQEGCQQPSESEYLPERSLSKRLSQYLIPTQTAEKLLLRNSFSLLTCYKNAGPNKSPWITGKLKKRCWNNNLIPMQENNYAFQVLTQNLPTKKKRKERAQLCSAVSENEKR